MTTQALKTTDLFDIQEKILDKQRLDYEDGIKLFESTDILTIGYLAKPINHLFMLDLL